MLLLLAAAPARAGWWVQDEFGLGGRGLVINQSAALVQGPRGLSASVEHMVYDADSLASPVNAFRGRLSLESGGGAWSLRPVVYPRAMGASSIGGSLSRSFFLSSDEDAATVLGVSAGGFRHDAPLTFADGVPSRSRLGEYFLEGSALQSYFGLFQLGFSADLFLYDRPLTGLAAFGGLADQGDLAGIASLRPLTKPPRAAATVQLARRGQPEVESQFFINYSHLRYAGDLGFAHSLLAGFDVKLPGGWRLDLSEHLLREQGEPWLGTTALLARYER